MLNDETKDRDSIPVLLQALFNSIDKLVERLEFDQKIYPVDKDYLLDVKPRMRKYNTNGV